MSTRTTSSRPRKSGQYYVSKWSATVQKHAVIFLQPDRYNEEQLERRARKEDSLIRGKNHSGPFV